MIPTSCGRLAGITEEYRQKVRKCFSTTITTQRISETALKGAFAELVYAGQDTSRTKTTR